MQRVAMSLGSGEVGLGGGKKGWSIVQAAVREHELERSWKPGGGGARKGFEAIDAATGQAVKLWDKRKRIEQDGGG